MPSMKVPFQLRPPVLIPIIGGALVTLDGVAAAFREQWFLLGASVVGGVLVGMMIYTYGRTQRMVAFMDGMDAGAAIQHATSHGWVPYGTHDPDPDLRLEFRGTDPAGLPIWEREIPE